MSKSRIKGVFFDLFGTLLIYDDLEKAWAAWYRELFSGILKMNPGIDEHNFAKICEGFYAKTEFSAGNNHFTVYEHRIENFCNEHNFNYTSSLIKNIADDTVESWQKFVSKDAVVEELLNEIRKTKIVVLISNFDHPRHIYKKLEEFNWKRLFDLIIISAEVGVKKPDKRIFEIALDEFNLLPEEVVYIGDSKEDIEGSKNAGIKPILIQRNGMLNEKQYDYNSPSEIPEMNWMQGVEVIKSLSEILNHI